MLIFMATQDMVDFHAKLFEHCLNNKGKSQETEVKKDSVTKDAEEIMNRFHSKVEDEPKMTYNDIPLLQLHGSMTQSDRMRVFKQFKEADSGVLLCTGKI